MFRSLVIETPGHMGYKKGIMPWKETCVMSERIKLISDYLSGEYGITELSTEYEIRRKTVYKWIARYEATGWSEILRRRGLSRVARRRRAAVPSEGPLSHCQEVNNVWCADFKGWFHTRDDNKCTPLTISDAHSRYLLCCQGLGGRTDTMTVRPLFIGTVRQYGMPEAIRTDNGTPFAYTALGALTTLAVWWVRLGIRLERIEPGSPQQNGRHERMHRPLKEATASPPRGTLWAQQQAFDEFRTETTPSVHTKRLGNNRRQSFIGHRLESIRTDYPASAGTRWSGKSGWCAR
jgi:transposase InsO family protein